ncbi:MAG: hypothetical protein R2799_03660 [Crocinitomicaceae bacterium]
MKKLELLNKFKLSSAECSSLFGGLGGKTYTQCVEVTYLAENCTDTTTEISNDEGVITSTTTSKPKCP